MINFDQYGLTTITNALPSDTATGMAHRLKGNEPPESLIRQIERSRHTSANPDIVAADGVR